MSKFSDFISKVKTFFKKLFSKRKEVEKKAKDLTERILSERILVEQGISEEQIISTIEECIPQGLKRKRVSFSSPSSKRAKETEEA